MFQVSLKVLTASQVLILVIASAGIIWTLESAYETTMSVMIPPLRRLHAADIAIEVETRLRPAVETVNLLEMMNVQYPTQMKCFNVSDDILDEFMSQLSQYATVFGRDGIPRVYMAFRVNSSFWGECSCQGNVTEAEENGTCSLFSKSYTVIPGKRFLEFPINNAFINQLTTRTYNYQLTHENIAWTTPEVTSTMTTISLAKSLEYDSKTNMTTKFVSVDVDLAFLSEVMEDMSADYDEIKERLIIVDTKSGVVLYGHYEVSGVHFSYMLNPATNNFYAANATPDAITNAMVTASGMKAGAYFSIRVDDVDFFCSTHAVIPPGPPTHWLVMSAHAGQPFVKEFRESELYVVVVACVACVISTGLAFLILRTVYVPLTHMSSIVLGAAKMQIDDTSANHVGTVKSFFTEVNTLQNNIDILISRLKEYRRYLPESVLSGKGYTNVVPADAGPEPNKGRRGVIQSKTINVIINYVQRNGVTRVKTTFDGAPVPVTTFKFGYRDAEVGVFDRMLGLVTEQALAVFGERTHKGVFLQFQSDEELDTWKTMYADLDLHLAVAVHSGGDTLLIRVGKKGHKNLTCIVRCASNIMVFGLFSTYDLYSLYSDGKTFFVTALIISLSAQVITNAIASYVVLGRIRDENAHVATWLNERKKEALFGRVVAIFDVLNLEVASSLMSGVGWSFCAPFSGTDVRLLERYSMLGFVFGPCMSLLINTVDVLTDNSLDIFEVALTFFCFVGVMLTMMRLVLLASFQNNNMREGTGTATQRPTNAVVDLHRKYVTLLHVVLIRDFHKSSLLEMEQICNSFYDITFRSAKQFGGVITSFTGARVVILFNGASHVPLHESFGVQCAFSILESINVCCGIVCDDMFVGNLGSSTRRSFQHISPANALCRSLAELAVRQQIGILATSDIVEACDCEHSYVATIIFAGTQQKVYAMCLVDEESDASIEQTLLLGSFIEHRELPHVCAQCIVLTAALLELTKEVETRKLQLTYLFAKIDEKLTEMQLALRKLTNERDALKHVILTEHMPNASARTGHPTQWSVVSLPLSHHRYSLSEPSTPTSVPSTAPACAACRDILQKSEVFSRDLKACEARLQDFMCTFDGNVDLLTKALEEVARDKANLLRLTL